MKKLKTDPTKTVLTITVGFIVIYLIAKWNWALIVALIIGLIGMFSSYLSKKIDFLWMKTGLVTKFNRSEYFVKYRLFCVFISACFIVTIIWKRRPIFLTNKRDSTFKKVDKNFDKSSFEKLW